MNAANTDDDLRTALMGRIGGRQYAPVGAGRRSRLGTWYPLMDADGRICEGLLVQDTGRFDAGFVRRVAEHVRRSGTRRPPGVVGLIDAMFDEQYGWLIADAPPARILAQQMGAPDGVAAQTMLAVAAESARLLLDLHAAGTAHGDVSVHTVALGVSGQVLLTEAGLAHLFAGTVPDPRHDVAGWVRLLDELRAATADRRAGQVLEQAARAAASTGGTAGLAAGLGRLSHGEAQTVPLSASAAGSAMSAPTIVLTKTPPAPGRAATALNHRYPAGEDTVAAEPVSATGTVRHRDGRTRLNVYLPEPDMRMNHVPYEPLPVRAQPPRHEDSGQRIRQTAARAGVKLPPWIRLDLIGSGLITAALLLGILQVSGRLG
ncbi:hypothetical protein ACFQO7_34060 [Catellatospora aurea]|uniref:Protein kinase domain-containing protein n=1 Tax=Catellatospora aurea TaxID=1337874 RepID=A0ABW2H6I3_9ACTN